MSVRTRVATALPLAIGVGLAIFYLPAPAFAVLVSVLMLAGFWEWTRLSGLPSRAVRALVLAVLAGLFAFYAWLPYPSLLWIAGVACVFWLFALAWLGRPGFGAADTRAHRTLKLLAGITLLSGAWAGAVYVRDGVPAQGSLWLIACLAVVFGGDTFAYFTGRKFGGRKLAPQISPGKTWAGFYGAVVGAVIVAAVAGWLLGLRGAPLLGWMGLAACCLLLSIAGDLFESLMKRHRQVKDSGRLFPGHGGVLDRGDSLFAALPAFALGLSWLLA